MESATDCALVQQRATDVNLGIELARTARPELILMNIDLPGISAIQFMKLLRADPATQNTLIGAALLVTGHPGGNFGGGRNIDK